MKEGRNNQLAYTVDNACDTTGLTRSRFYKAISDGSLVTFKAGRRRMVSARALEDFIRKLEAESQGKAA